MSRLLLRVLCLCAAPAAAIVIALGASSAARDAPAIKPITNIPARHDWSGFYVGGHVGYDRGRANAAEIAPSPSNATASFGSAFGGLQAGYNIVLTPRVLLGVETDITFHNFLEGNDVVTSWAMANRNTFEKLDFVSTLRGRIGGIYDRWLIYGTGGFAWSQARFSETPGVTNDEDKILLLRTGWTVGGGIETAVAQDWTLRLEYLHTELGKISATLPSGTRVESSLALDSVRLGLNRQLRWPGESAPTRSRASPDLANADNWNIHGQITAIGQGYYHFRSPYQGANSLSGANQFRNTGSATAFLGLRLWDGATVYFNPELNQGFGLSDVRGVAAFPNGEAQKSNFPVPRFNMARLFIRQTFGLGGAQETLPDAPNQIAEKVDVSRITVTVGKFATTDIFNGNAYANDPRTSFLNWNIYGGGSYDWTMDKLSWTWGAVTELNQKHWAFRVGYFLVPTESNSNAYDMHIPARGEFTAELELRYSFFAQPGKFRIFGWINRAIMGGYADAVALPAASANYPDITLTRRVRNNYGIVLNAEQAISNDIGVFSRASWSPGLVEIIGWTDTSASLSFGTAVKGTSWGRPNDRIGLAGVVEALSSDAKSYFRAGGMGILIGDGQLNYRQEKVLETYYAYALNGWSSLTLDYQLIANPGYNADRGPVSVYSARYHAEF